VRRLYSADMANFPRYAIYYVSEPGSDLDRFGAQLLGYDAFSGEDLPFPDGVAQIAPDWQEVTRDPRKYGFHATLKAPLALAHGKTEAQLVTACEAFAAAPRPIPVIRPVVGSISGFIAVVPLGPSAAPLTPEDLLRRNPSALTPRQCEYLDRWGYPYVMEDFRFHMTLTGRLDAGRREPILTMLRERFSTIGLTNLAIDRIALFRQYDAHSRFRIVNHWKLRASPASDQIR